MRRRQTLLHSRIAALLGQLGSITLYPSGQVDTWWYREIVDSWVTGRTRRVWSMWFGETGGRGPGPREGEVNKANMRPSCDECQMTEKNGEFLAIKRNEASDKDRFNTQYVRGGTLSSILPFVNAAGEVICSFYILPADVRDEEDEESAETYTDFVISKPTRRTTLWQLQEEPLPRRGEKVVGPAAGGWRPSHCVFGGSLRTGTHALPLVPRHYPEVLFEHGPLSVLRVDHSSECEGGRERMVYL